MEFWGGWEIGTKPERVCAVVVTFNRKDLLLKCCSAVAEQLSPDDCLLVVDNASTDGTPDVVRQSFPAATVLSLAKNVGGAGGFSEGMKWAHQNGFDYLWIMDDDGIPSPNCLSLLKLSSGGRLVAVPIQKDSGGRFYGISTWQGRNIDITNDILTGLRPARGSYLFTFVGPLIPRWVIDRIGLPDAEFFIWFDDHEYSLRLAEAEPDQVLTVQDATFLHDMGANSRQVSFLGIKSTRSDVSPWKLYYGIRNPLYTFLHKRRKIKEIALFSAVQARLLLMDLCYGPNRSERFYWRFLGVRDGVLGRLGRRH